MVYTLRITNEILLHSFLPDAILFNMFKSFIVPNDFAHCSPIFVVFFSQGLFFSINLFVNVSFLAHMVFTCYHMSECFPSRFFHFYANIGISLLSLYTSLFFFFLSFHTFLNCFRCTLFSSSVWAAFVRMHAPLFCIFLIYFVYCLFLTEACSRKWRSWYYCTSTRNTTVNLSWGSRFLLCRADRGSASLIKHWFSPEPWERGRNL